MFCSLNTKIHPQRSGAALVLAAMLPLAAFAAPYKVDDSLPRYQPKPVTIAKDATYVRPDGSVFLAGASASRNALANLNALFQQSHPEVKFTTLQPGSSVGPPAILYGLAAFAVINREILPEEVVPFEYMLKRPPIGIRVGRGGFGRRDYSSPMAVWVHKNNPITKLTTEQVARIFTVGGGKGDISSWGQLGLEGDWARRPIHLLGPRPRTGVGVYMRVEKFGDFSWSDRYEGMKSPEIGSRLEENVSAIALADTSYAPKDAKRVAIAETEGGYYSDGNLEDVLSGKYPYTRYTYFYINHERGKPLDPFVKEYLLMVLSKEGQQAITAEENGFLPLTAQDVQEQLKLLEEIEKPVTK